MKSSMLYDFIEKLLQYKITRIFRAFLISYSLINL